MPVVRVRRSPRRLATAGDEIQLLDAPRRARSIQDADDDALAVVAGDDRDAEVDLDLAPAALHAHTEAAVLRAAPLGDVELGQDLDARHDLAHVPIEPLLTQAEMRLAQHAIDAEPQREPRRLHLEVDIAAVNLDRVRQNLAKQVVGPAAELLVGGGRCRDGRLGGHEVRKAQRLAERLRRIRVGLVQPTIGLLNRPVRGGHDRDRVSGQPPEVVDHLCRGRVVHRHRQRPPDLRHRQDHVATCVAGIDQPREAAVDEHLVQIEERHLELLAQHLPHRLVSDVVQFEEDFAERELQRLLLQQRMLELQTGDGALGNQEFAEPGAIGTGRGLRGIGRALTHSTILTPAACEGRQVRRLYARHVTPCRDSSFRSA